MKGNASSSPSVASLTTYDILKTAAVLLMIVDHLGYYFFPDHLFLRAIGRWCLPIWFFLIGYARSRRIDAALIGGALFLSGADFLLGRPVLPLNILYLMMAIRLTLNPVMRFIGGNDMLLLAVTLVLFIFAPLSGLLLEYGTLGFLLAIAGYLARNGYPSNTFMPYIYGVIAWGLFVVAQHTHFHFPLALDAVVAAGSAATMLAVYFYLPCGNAIGFSVPSAPLRAFFRFGGRHTLAIYVAHLLLFKIVFFWLCHCSDCSCRPFGVSFMP